MNDSSFNIRVPKKWARVGMIAVVTALIVAPLTAWAADAFTDVPDSNTFHDDIAWLKDAGVTLGCNPPSNTLFCPKDNVTREQMSAFMRRLAENKVVNAATAVEADNATTADSATTADDAGTLDGFDSTDLVPGGTPPAGTTIRGTFWMGASASAAFDLATSEISFGYDIGAAPTPHFIENGDTPPAACPGTKAAPEAAPGHLCVYESLSSSAGVRDVNGPTGDGSTYSIGARLFVRSSGATQTFYSGGTWAVTVADTGASTSATEGNGNNAGQ